MVRAAIVALAIAAGTSAAAQTTTCVPTIPGTPSAGVTCKTREGKSGAPIDPRNVRPVPCTAFERNIIGDGRELCDAREIAAKRKAVGDLIAAGKCSDATKAALSMGDISFAREVRDFCTPPQDAVR